MNIPYATRLIGEIRLNLSYAKLHDRNPTLGRRQEGFEMLENGTSAFFQQLFVYFVIVFCKMS